MSMLQQIHTGRRPSPPRFVIYGTEGIGKSTTAAQAPKPIFIPTEDGGLQIWLYRSESLEKLAVEHGHLCSNDPTVPTGQRILFRFDADVRLGDFLAFCAAYDETYWSQQHAPRN